MKLRNPEGTLWMGGTRGVQGKYTEAPVRQPFEMAMFKAVGEAIP
jgi:hypothetical protein